MELVSISKNMHGTRAVQRLIETLETPEEFKLVRDALKVVLYSSLIAA